MVRERAKAELVVTAAERATLLQWGRRRKTAQAMAQRARIVLACATGEINSAMATQRRVSGQMAGKWRARFVARPVDGLLDERRPGTPRRISDEHIEKVITLTLETMPREVTHWSTRTRAARKVRDIVGMSPAPPGKALVLCVDEQSHGQALAPRSGQLRHAQDGPDPPLAGEAPALPRALHADECLVAHSGRAVVRAAHGEAALALRRGVHRSTRELETSIKRYLAMHNEDPKPFVWTKTADQILEAVARFCRRTSDSGH